MDDWGVSALSKASGNYYDRILSFPIAMPIGSYDKEIVNLNVDSLWRGGPFESPVRGSVYPRFPPKAMKILRTI